MEPYRIDIYLEDGTFYQAVFSVEAYVRLAGDFAATSKFAEDVLACEATQGNINPIYKIDRIELYDHDILVRFDVPEDVPDDDDQNIDNDVYHDDLETAVFEEHEERSTYWTRSMNIRYETHIVRNPTELLIHLYGSKETQDAIKSRSQKMLKIWQTIANKMAELGYPIPEKIGKTTGKQCDDKFRPIKSKYLKYLRPKTGEGALNKPPYFDILHKYLGGKEITAPTCLNDSLAQRRTGTASKRPLNPNNVRPSAGPYNIQASNGPSNVQPSTGPSNIQASNGPSNAQPSTGPSNIRSSNSDVPPSAKQSRFACTQSKLKPNKATTGDVLKVVEAAQIQGKKELEAALEMHKKDYAQMERFLKMYAIANNLPHIDDSDKENDAMNDQTSE